ncbi:MAG: 4-hydroxybenzoate octaprenyltransferase [Desulfobacteraceae bacterium IS3]|nr:MAG: 4-hydroxybenzoate octaprenyltransferase [Desulfobacteraceae bacterium IS3]
MIERIMTYGRMVKFSHTVFALPFALSAVVLVHRDYPITFGDIFWILLAMVGGRSAAMGFNRIADAKTDARNPRTANREIPAGKLSLNAAAIFVLLSASLFVFASAMLGRLCFYLSFPVLVVLLSYSYTKRFTWLAHLYLGFAISLAPAGAWIAIANDFSWQTFLLSFALMSYITGFDILYACQDTDFDRNEGLFSVPVKFGVKNALFIAKIVHLLSFAFFISIFFVFDMGMIYLSAVFVIGGLFIFEHSLVKPDDLSHINIAFFHVNSLISVILFIGVFFDELM